MSLLFSVMDEIFERQGRAILKLPNPRTDLANLLDLLNDVRKLGFKRIEFRACQIGADQEAMKKVAGFLKVKTVVGPKKVETFYGAIPLSSIQLIRNDAKLTASLKRLGGRTLPRIGVGLLMLPRAPLVRIAEPRAPRIEKSATRANGARWTSPCR